MLHTGSKGAVGPEGLPGGKDSCQHSSGPEGPPGQDGSPGHPGQCLLKSFDQVHCQL